MSEVKVNKLNTRTNTALTIQQNSTDAITIDTSQNVFIKTTGTGTNIGIDAVSTGYYLRDGGQFRVARDNSQPILANRLNGDGVIIDCRKDGTTVGQIGSKGGTDLTVGSGDTGLRFRDADNAIWGFNTSTNADRDNAIALGASGARFSNLYLGGNIYLGGTGSANALDDYEEGTHQVSITGSSGGSATVGDNATRLKYIKIGKEVWVHGEIHITGISSISGTVKVSLPFAVADTSDLAERGVGNCALRSIDVSSGVVQVTPFCYGGQSFFTFKEMYDNSSWGEIAGSALSSGDEFVVSLQYTTS